MLIACIIESMALAELLSALDGDDWRKQNPFSPEMSTATDVLLHPYAREDERQLAIKAWLFKHQPCVFGQVAAKGDGLYIAVIHEELLVQGDDVVREKLSFEKKTWKQWSLGQKGRHGLLVAFVSPKLHFAAPNQALRNLSMYLRSLFVNAPTKDPAGNDVCHEWLYLQNTNTSQFVKFRVILDYFAAAGDMRWWHDHRFPGGVAFTLNSLGHMVRTKEWYEKLDNPIEWGARLAMLTISNAFPHPKFGKATSLLDLQNGKPLKAQKCPFLHPEKLPDKLKAKDWTTYSGTHHTDHSIRSEFFDEAQTPNRERGDYLLDFTYLTGGIEGENAELTSGVAVSEEEVFQDIGTPDEWRRKKPARYAGPTRPPEAEMEINEALAKCKEWLIE